jgi:hypothetical protein
LLFEGAVDVGLEFFCNPISNELALALDGYNCACISFGEFGKSCARKPAADCWLAMFLLQKIKDIIPSWLKLRHIAGRRFCWVLATREATFKNILRFHIHLIKEKI